MATSEDPICFEHSGQECEDHQHSRHLYDYSLQGHKRAEKMPSEEDHRPEHHPAGHTVNHGDVAEPESRMLEECKMVSLVRGRGNT